MPTQAPQKSVQNATTRVKRGQSRGGAELVSDPSLAGYTCGVSRICPCFKILMVAAARVRHLPMRSEPLGCCYRLDSRDGPLGGQDFDLVEV